MGERLTDGYLRDRIKVRGAGAGLFLDAMTLEGDIAAHLARLAVAAAGAMVSLLYVAENAKAQLPTLPALLPDAGGASLLREDALFLRAVAPDGHLLRATLVAVLERLTGNALPPPWMI